MDENHVFLLRVSGFEGRCKLTHELKLWLDGINRAILDYSAESVSHNGDQHVEHCHLRDKSRTDKEKVAQGDLVIWGKVV